MRLCCTAILSVIIIIMKDLTPFSIMKDLTPFSKAIIGHKKTAPGFPRTVWLVRGYGQSEDCPRGQKSVAHLTRLLKNVLLQDLTPLFRKTWPRCSGFPRTVWLVRGYGQSEDCPRGQKSVAHLTRLLKNVLLQDLTPLFYQIMPFIPPYHCFKTIPNHTTKKTHLYSLNEGLGCCTRKVQTFNIT